MSLADLISTKKTAEIPPVFIIYGPSGVGKTTFASTFESPVLIRIEDGARGIDIPTFPKVYTELNEIMGCVMSLTHEQHDFKTLVIDSLDWLEPIVWDYTAKTKGKESIEDWGYQKGYKVYAINVWKDITSTLDILRKKRGMNIVLLAHTQRVNVKNPDSEGFLQYDLKLEGSAREYLREWADEVYFLHTRLDLIKDKANTTRASGGIREIITQDETACQAKTRKGIMTPITIGHNKTFEEFHKAYKEN